MTQKRKQALQWFYDRGMALRELAAPDAPSAYIMNLMEDEGQLVHSAEGWTLTDKGREDLWDAERGL